MKVNAIISDEVWERKKRLQLITFEKVTQHKGINPKRTVPSLKETMGAHKMKGEQ
jgi:hypothetical protein